jgi:hypothetical protein
MVDYSLGKIYKLIGNGLTYYGSTCEPTLARRLSGHVTACKNNKCKRRACSYIIIEQGNYNIILIENFPCQTKDELYARERFYIENNNCINKKVPGRGKKEGDKLYYLKNKESINMKSSEKFICNCGGECRVGDKARHFKTQKHINYTTRELLSIV